MQITTNTNALSALKGIYAANAAIAKASERISTGLRVNHASDDPAGLGMANRLKTYIGSFSKVLDNVSQGAAVTQIVSDSLSQISDLLGYIRVAAVAAENTSLSTTDQQAYQDEIDAYVTQIDSISSGAIWNGTSLMSTSSTMSIQSGIGSSDSTSVTFDKITASELGVDSLDVSSSSTVATNATSAAAAVTSIDTAISTIETYQAYIGAKANVFDVQTSLTNSNITNYSAAYGKIMNADMAQETSNLAAAQIQRDAATAMLTQANSMNKELVTYLLKSSYN